MIFEALQYQPIRIKFHLLSTNIKKSVKTIEDNITKCIEKDISKLKEDMNRGLTDKCKCFN